MVVQQAFANGIASSSRIVSLFVLSPSTQSERRFSINITISDLRNKLASITGIAADSQIISLHDGSGSSNATSYNDLAAGRKLASLSDDAATLESYGVVQDGFVLNVMTRDQATMSALHSFVEDANVKLYEMTADEYEKRRDTVLAFKARNKIGRFASPPPLVASDETAENNLPPVGSRVRVDKSGEGIYVRSGTVRYTGSVDFGPGDWIGVEYDEPVGLNDGIVQGRRYFSCRAKYGGFVKPCACTIASHDEGGGTDDELGMSDE